MRKSVSLLMAAAMTAALLAGCSGNSGTNGTTTTPAGGTTAEADARETNAKAAAQEANAEATAQGTTTEAAAQETSTAETMSTEAETGTGASGTGAENSGAADGSSKADAGNSETADPSGAGTNDSGDAGGTTLRVGSLKGPTSMGLVSLMDKAEIGEAQGNYEFTMVTDASELVAKMVSGDLDIALVPANMASILYQKTNQNVKVLNINTLGVLYVVAADDSIQSIADLAGKTIYMTGKGTTPDYVLQYLLSANGLSTDDLTIEYKSEATEVAAVLQEQADAIGLLPQPFVTVAMAQNENLKMVLDLTAEWDKANADSGDGGSLVTGVTAARNEVLADAAGAAAVNLFLDEQKESAAFTGEDAAAAAELVAQFGIIEKAPVAQKALPYCSIVCIEGDEMETMLSGYLNVLYNQDPASVGGQLPDEAFYYKR